MDNAVALVQAYLQINGYFTVAEYPIIEAHRLGGYSARTDIDILAFRFPGAGQLITSHKPHEGSFSHESDPALQLNGRADMIIGEVKEGRAELNAGATESAVIAAALARFGCCPLEHAQNLARKLVKAGHAETHAGHQARLMAFGSTPPKEHSGYGFLSLGHIHSYLEKYIRDNWDIISTLHFKDSIFGLLVTLEKARRGGGAPR